MSLDIIINDYKTTYKGGRFITNGTSQGLFVFVAIIIFGIFLFISYLLFRDTLKPSLGGIFTDGLEQGLCSLKITALPMLKLNEKTNNLSMQKYVKQIQVKTKRKFGLELTNNLMEHSLLLHHLRQIVTMVQVAR